MARASSWLRIAVVQFAPKIGEVQANIAKARELCRALTPRSVDLVCLPEMIFTGYIFPDAPSIEPYLEHPNTGPTASFCADLARRLQCVVVAGFPQRIEPAPAPSVSSSPSPSLLMGAPPLMGANAALLYGPTGTPLHLYHKSNLFPTDRTWALPGAGFTALDLPAPLGRVGVAICNDLNVRTGEEWVSVEEGPYELAEWCRKEDVRVLVLLNAWLRHEDGGVGESASASSNGEETGTGDNGGEEEGEDDEDRLEPNWEVLNYWAVRLRPLWAPNKRIDLGAKTDVTDSTRSSEPSAVNGTASHANEARNVIVVCCNRFGHERGKTFAGSSAMFSMRPGSGKPRLLHVMGEREEGVRVWTAGVGSETLPS